MNGHDDDDARPDPGTTTTTTGTRAGCGALCDDDGHRAIDRAR
jgi:hypothetical protein